MPVNWQRVPITLAQGLDTKTDGKQVVPGKLTTLENGVFATPGSIRKRYGLSSRSLNVEGSGSITRGVALAAFDNETLLFDGNYAWSWVDSSGKWLRRGTARSLETTSRSIIADTRSQKSLDVAVTGSLALYAYEEHETYKVGARCTVVDTETNQVLINNELLDQFGYSPRCAAFSGALYVVYNTVSQDLRRSREMTRGCSPEVVQRRAI